jgi:maleate cis-trans isomerase
VVEHDLAQWRPVGMTFHAGRMHITNPNLSNDEEFEGLIEQLETTIEDAVERVLTCKPDYMMMGMSAGTFWGGLEGSKRFTKKIEELSGLSVSTGSTSTAAALDAFGVKRIAVFSPYQPVADKQVSAFFTEAGFDVVSVTGLRCKTATAIAEVTPEEIGRTIREIDGGKETAKSNLPLIIAGKKGLVEEKDLRIPNMRGIMTARTKALNIVEPSSDANATSSIKFEKPAPKSAVKLISADNLDELINLLHNEAKVI